MCCSCLCQGLSSAESCDPPGLAPRAPFLSVQEQSRPHSSGAVLRRGLNVMAQNVTQLGCVCMEGKEAESLVLIWGEVKLSHCVCVEAMESSGL